MEKRPIFSREAIIPNAGDTRWYGERLSDLSRDQLMSIIVQMNEQIRFYQSPEQSSMRAKGRVEMIKDGTLSL